MLYNDYVKNIRNIKKRHIITGTVIIAVLAASITVKG